MVTAAVAGGGGRLCDTLNAPTNRSAQTKKQRLQRRSTVEAVERAISEHLGEQSIMTTSVMKVDGLSLKELGLDNGISMGLGWCWDVRGWGGVCFVHRYLNCFFLSGVGLVYLSGVGVTILYLRSWGGISFDHGYLNGLVLSGGVSPILHQRVGVVYSLGHGFLHLRRGCWPTRGRPRSRAGSWAAATVHS